ncbi:hypothetical protein BT93_E1606 [Corymbia citriodora subsp. variegata]|nr:hypothetical protein BT93_E1606 [Corymbia citriodora subsp. variegata]
MDQDGDSPFSNGLYLANLAVSSNLVEDSWNAISELEQQINQNFLLHFVKRVFPQLEPTTFRSYRDNPVIIKEFHCPNYNIIAFVTLPVTTSHLQEEKDCGQLEIPDFQFLFSKSSPTTFRMNSAAISLFNSLPDELSGLKEKVVTSAKSKNPVPYIITGRSLGGSIASLFTLLLLNKLGPTKNTPLCITFGSPLLGDSNFQQAVSPWNSCFLHLVHKDDTFPRLSFCPPTTNQSPFMPFSTFLLCSESGGACFEAPESVMKLLMSEIVGNKQSQRVDYRNIIRCLQKRLIHGDCFKLNGEEADLYKTGVATQVTAVRLKPIQQQDEGTDALIGDIVKHERRVIISRKEAFDPAKELDQMKVYLAYLEWYMKVCKSDGQGPGYYNSFKNARERRDSGVDKYKTILTNYWERVVNEAEKKPHLLDVPLRARWLYGGTSYRRIVEPLDIAEHYKRGRKDYLKRGRSRHYILLEKWLKQHQEKKGRERAGPSNSKLENIESRLTEDSCFWARVEEAIRLCRLLDSGGSPDGSEREKLVKFEEDVMELIKNYAVSPDIFLEKSSYMQWWREYDEMLEKRKVELSLSSESPLVGFMRNDPCKNYIEGSVRVNGEGDLIENIPDASESDATSTRGPSVLFASLSWASLSRPVLLSLLLLLLLFHFLGHHLQKHIF